MNPKQQKAYAGPAGSVHGTISVTGDPAPDEPEVLAQIREECAPAREVYGKLFREGPGRRLADVLVAVTGYDGYVPAEHSVVQIDAAGCAWSSRTIALTLGQRLDVVSKDHKAYVPDLMGAKMPAQLVALPGGSASSLFADEPGRYLLMDSLRIFSRAEVLVVKFATFAVTGLDGHFDISRIPAGKGKLNALLPATGQTLERDIEISPSRPLELNLTFEFDAQQFSEAKRAASASATPPSPPPPASNRAPAPAKTSAAPASAPKAP